MSEEEKPLNLLEYVSRLFGPVPLDEDIYTHVAPIPRIKLLIHEPNTRLSPRN